MTPTPTHLQAMEEQFDQEGEWWRAESHDLTSTITLDHRVKSKQLKCSAALRTPSGMLEHHPDQHMKLTEKLPPMCEAVITEKRGHFEEYNK